MSFGNSMPAIFIPPPYASLSRPIIAAFCYLAKSAVAAEAANSSAAGLA
jgi:hypothetical protein